MLIYKRMRTQWRSLLRRNLEYTAAVTIEWPSETKLSAERHQLLAYFNRKSRRRHYSRHAAPRAAVYHKVAWYRCPSVQYTITSGCQHKDTCPWKDKRYFGHMCPYVQYTITSGCQHRDTCSWEDTLQLCVCVFFLLIRPHCFEHSDRIQQTILRPGNKTTGFRYWIEMQSPLQKNDKTRESCRYNAIADISLSNSSEDISFTSRRTTHHCAPWSDVVQASKYTIHNYKRMQARRHLLLSRDIVCTATPETTGKTNTRGKLPCRRKNINSRLIITFYQNKVLIQNQRFTLEVSTRMLYSSLALRTLPNRS